MPLVSLIRLGQPKPGLLVMWGSAAWAQTQLTPGVSTRAAPRSLVRPSHRLRDRTGKLRTGPETNTEESGIAVWQRCFICGLAMTGDGGGEQEM